MTDTFYYPLEIFEDNFEILFEIKTKTKINQLPCLIFAILKICTICC